MIYVAEVMLLTTTGSELGEDADQVVGCFAVSCPSKYLVVSKFLQRVDKTDQYGNELMIGPKVESYSTGPKTCTRVSSRSNVQIN